MSICICISWRAKIITPCSNDRDRRNIKRIYRLFPESNFPPEEKVDSRCSKSVFSPLVRRPHVMQAWLKSDIACSLIHKIIHMLILIRLYAGYLATLHYCVLYAILAQERFGFTPLSPALCSGWVYLLTEAWGVNKLLSLRGRWPGTCD